MEEKDLEGGLSNSASAADWSSQNEKAEDVGFEPIKKEPSRPTSARRPSDTIHRTRSNNGFGVDDLDVDEGGESNKPNAPLSAEDTYEVSWEGGDSDPMNPRSMGVARKWFLVIATSAGALCVTCGSSIYTSTYEQMDREFGNSEIVATLGLSTYVLGVALGPVWSPLSEFYGRRPIYCVSFLLFIIWLVPGALSKNIQTMIIARFFQGLSGAAFLSVSGGTVSDLFNPDEMAAPMTIFTLAPFIGPSLGPLVGGFINSNVSWRWTHYLLIIWASIEFLVLTLLVPETYHPMCLRNKARKIRKETGDERWKAPIEKLQRSLLKTIGIALVRPFQLLFFEPMLTCLCIFCALLLGVLYLFFGAIPLVFETNHHFTLWQVGLAFFGIGIGMSCASILNPIWKNMRNELIAKRAAATGVEAVSEPEDRLPPTMAGAFLCPIGLFIFGWTTFPWVHWILPIIGSTIFGAGTFLVFNGVFTFLVDAYPEYAASALAANAFVRNMFASAFPLFGDQMYKKLGYAWASSLLGFLTIAMVPFPFIFYKYGKAIRGTSRYATASS